MTRVPRKQAWNAPTCTRKLRQLGVGPKGRGKRN